MSYNISLSVTIFVKQFMTRFKEVRGEEWLGTLNSKHTDIKLELEPELKLLIDK